MAGQDDVVVEVVEGEDELLVEGSSPKVVVPQRSWCQMAMEHFWPLVCPPWRRLMAAFSHSC